jgi:hypothetical protein
MCMQSCPLASNEGIYSSAISASVLDEMSGQLHVPDSFTIPPPPPGRGAQYNLNGRQGEHDSRPACFRKQANLLRRLIFVFCATVPSGPEVPQYQGFSITLKDTPHSVLLLWTSDHPDAETATWQHTTLIRDKHLCPLRNSNPQSQQTCYHRLTP